MSPFSLRFAAATSALLAMTHGGPRCLIELPMPGVDGLEQRVRARRRDGAASMDPDGVDMVRVYAAYEAGRAAFFREIAQRLRRLGGRPHWGLVNELDAASARVLYSDSWPRFAAIAATHRAGRFAGPYAERLGLGAP
jgi:hypothetical protein